MTIANDGDAPDAVAVVPMESGAKESGGDAVIDADSGACSGTCTPPPPIGWSFVAFDPFDHQDCPTGYGPAVDTIENLKAVDATCQCKCGVQTQPTCDISNPSITFSADPQCANGTTTNLSANQCANQAISYANNGTTYATGTATTAIKGGACGIPQLTKTVPPPQSHPGRSCALTTPTSCPNGTDQCVPGVPSDGNFYVCIEHDGEVACPNDYPTAHTLGVGIDDTRDCSACSCDLFYSGCSAVAKFHTAQGCAGNPNVQLPLDGSCWTIGNPIAFASDIAVVTPQGVGCKQGASFGPTGGVALDKPRTICCR
jgi:hypothetical protein